MIEHGLGVADLKRIGWTVIYEAWFNEEFFDFAVFNQHAVAPGAIAETEIGFFDEHSHAASEIGIAIWQHFDF